MKAHRHFDSTWPLIKLALMLTLVLSFTVNSTGQALASPPASPLPDGIEGLKNAMVTLATAFLSLLMIAASILLSVGIATGAVSGMFGATTGSPYVLAQSWFKIISIILLAVIAFASPLIAGTVISTVAGMGGGAIPVFGG